MQRIWRKMLKTGGSEGGQTLILAVVAIIILLIAILFLFDLQSMIRLKVKAQSGTDAAALAGCNWQVNSLNLIGELNLIKACTVLISDIPPFGDDSEAGITESSETLTEMQSRIAFVGPMIGFGAAQQAAKSNGLNSNLSYSTRIRQAYVDELMVDESVDDPDDPSDDYYNDWTRYGGEPGHPKAIEGYNWRYPYRVMVQSVINEVATGGIAVGVNAEGSFLATDPPWLAYLGLYDAIAAEDWCNPVLRELLKNFDFSGKWWDVVFDSSVNPWSLIPQSTSSGKNQISSLFLSDILQQWQPIMMPSLI